MSNGTLPGYLKSATPNPAENRTAWYKNLSLIHISEPTRPY